MTEEKIESKIKELKKRIKDLQSVYKGDVRESYREATQTQDMILQYQSQLEAMIKQQTNNSLKTVVLKSHNGKKQIYKLTTSKPDPSNGIISLDSPIGKKLNTAQKGDSVQIGEIDYIIE